MKIIWRRIARGDKDIVVAFVETDNLDLGIDTYLLPLDPSPSEPIPVMEVQDDSDDDGDVVVDIVPPVTEFDGPFNLNDLYFRVETYQKLIDNPEQVWDPLLLPANRFFSMLSADDLKQFCLFFIDARKTIDRELVRGAITDVATYLGNRLYDLAVDIKLPEKLLHYVKHQSDIPIPDLSYAGTNASRDNEAMTIRIDEYYVLLAISVLCKILFPIWGDLIERTRGDVDNMLKETQCINVVEPVLHLPVFRDVRAKIYNYISNIVDTEMNNSYPTAAFSATIGGVSHSRFHHIVFSNLIVKRFVSIDLYLEEKQTDGSYKRSNIMVWVSACSKQAFRSFQTTLNKHCRIMPRTDISDGADYGDDERNASVLENSSRVTDVTADVPALLRFGVQMAIPRLCREYDVSDLEFRQAMHYYHKNPIQVTMFNKIFVGIFTGTQIGGAQGLKYLERPQFMELVAIVQLHIAKQFAASSVVHFLTASTPEEERPVLELSSINSMIITTARKTYEYQGCENLFPYAIDGISVGTSLKRIQDYIVKYPHHVNTAPFVAGTMDEDVIPAGSLLMYEPDVMQQCCEIILKRINPRGVPVTEGRLQPLGA